MFGKLLELMAAVTHKEHLTEHLHVWADSALPPGVTARAACPPAGHGWDMTSVQDSWHGLSESPCELWDNVSAAQQFAAVLFSRLYSLLATVALACICVFCNCVLLPVFQHEFQLVSHKNICHSCLFHAAPLASSCLQHLFSGKLK